MRLLFDFSYVVPPARIERTLSAPQADVLSIERRGQIMKLFFLFLKNLLIAALVSVFLQLFLKTIRVVLHLILEYNTLHESIEAVVCFWLI